MSSSTQSSDLSSSIQSSASTTFSYRDLSGSDILIDTKRLQTDGIHYAAKENIVSQCEFVFNKEIRGEVLVPKDKDKKGSEFVLTGIFEIDPRNFFMTSDGKWNSNNPLGTRFDQVKPSCQLLPVQRNDEFSYSIEDYPAIIANIHSIENLANPRKSRDIHSIIIGDAVQASAIRLTHHLFVVRCLSYQYRPLLIFIKKRIKKTQQIMS